MAADVLRTHAVGQRSAAAAAAGEGGDDIAPQYPTGFPEAKAPPIRVILRG